MDHMLAENCIQSDKYTPYLCKKKNFFLNFYREFMDSQRVSTKTEGSPRSGLGVLIQITVFVLIFWLMYWAWTSFSLLFFPTRFKIAKRAFGQI